MSALIAVHAASFIGSGIGKSGKPCARFTASCRLAMRVISRITDSVNVAVLLAACFYVRRVVLRVARHDKATSARDLRQSAANEVGRGQALAILVDRQSYRALGVRRRVAKRNECPNGIFDTGALWSRAGGRPGDMKVVELVG